MPGLDGALACVLACALTWALAVPAAAFGAGRGWVPALCARAR